MAKRGSRGIGREERWRKEGGTLTSLRVYHVSNFEGYGSKATLVVSPELALIKDLNKDFRRLFNGAVRGMRE
jgi:hypothetical protein